MNERKKRLPVIFAFLAISLLVTLQFSEIEAKSVAPAAPQILPGGVYPSRANDINEKGESVGYSNNTWWFKKAVKWTANGEMIDLGFLPGTNMSVANGINNKGDVVGYCGQYITLRGGGIVDMNYRATLWTAEGKIIDLGTLPGSESIANEINNHGEVVGRTYIRWIEHGPTNDYSVRTSYHAFYWNIKDGIKDLGSLPGGNASVANDINDKGQIAGFASNGTNTQAAIWTKNGSITSLGTLPTGKHSYAYGINEKGQVVGYSSVDVSISYPSSTLRAFLWTAKEGMTPLETLPDHASFALSINNNGQIVGYSYFNNNWFPIWNASLWTSKGNLIQLEPLQSQSSQALNINNKGQIVGASYLIDPSYNTIGDAVLWSKLKRHRQTS